MVMNLLIGIYLSLQLDLFGTVTTLTQEEDDGQFQIPENHICYLENDEPFFSWEHYPDSIDFQLFDRWGSLIGRSKDPDFTLEEALIDQILYFPPTPFFYTLCIYRESKVYEEHMGTSTFLGFYCSG
jgi:hypothetical protein